MASSTTGITSGADFDSQATRRRNVPSTSPSGGLVNREEIDKKKTQVKQVSCDGIFPLDQTSLNVSLINPLAEPTNIPTSAG
jgi:hypothetical protein